MGPASYLTAPPRVAGRSIAPLASHAMLVVLWVAVAVGVVAPAGALVGVVRAGLGAWREYRGASSELSVALHDLTRRVEGFSHRGAATPGPAPRPAARR